MHRNCPFHCTTCKGKAGFDQVVKASLSASPISHVFPIMDPSSKVASSRCIREIFSFSWTALPLAKSTPSPVPSQLPRVGILRLRHPHYCQGPLRRAPRRVCPRTRSQIRGRIHREAGESERRGFLAREREGSKFKGRKHVFEGGDKADRSTPSARARVWQRQRWAWQAVLDYCLETG